MADYDQLVEKAISKLDDKSTKSRQKLYARIRSALVKHFENQSPQLDIAFLAAEQAALERAISSEEASWKYDDERRSHAVCIDEVKSDIISNKPLIYPTLTVDVAKGERHEELQPKKPSVVANLLKGTAGIAVSVACVVVPMALFVAYLHGALWISEHLLISLIAITPPILLLCLLIFGPMLAFKALRGFGSSALLACSFFFGVTGWLLGLTTAYQYLGMGGVVVGLFLGIVGVVPLGIIGAVWHGDWLSASALCVGLILTFGIRALAFVGANYA